VEGAKALMRARASAGRRAMDAGERAAAGAAICRAVLRLPEVTAARTVASYLSIGTEPATVDLVAALSSRGVRVLVPVLRADLDLDWAGYDPGAPLRPGAGGVPEPPGARLGPSAVADADVVLVPALAVDAHGARLGRGGGSYDRALARVAPGRAVVALLYDGEVHPTVPSEPHDRPVTMAVTPTTVWRF
jgi:5-formyltetrahydrofolate cyclo-ligase